MLCYPFLCVIALRALREQAFLTGAQSSAEQQQQRAWTVKCPLAVLWLLGIYFLSGNMTSAGCEAQPGLHQTPPHSWAAAVLPCTPAAPSRRKERRSRRCTKSLPQESPSAQERKRRSWCHSAPLMARTLTMTPTHLVPVARGPEDLKGKMIRSVFRQ